MKDLNEENILDLINITLNDLWNNRQFNKLNLFFNWLDKKLNLNLIFKKNNNKIFYNIKNK